MTICVSCRTPKDETAAEAAVLAVPSAMMGTLNDETSTNEVTTGAFP